MMGNFSLFAAIFALLILSHLFAAGFGHVVGDKQHDPKNRPATAFLLLFLCAVTWAVALLLIAVLA